MLDRDPPPVPSRGVRHFVVLGAGASAGARDDYEKAVQPPLGAELARYLMRWMAANDPRQWDQGTRIRARYELELPYPCKVIAEASPRKEMLALLSAAARAGDEEHVGFELAMQHLWGQRNGRLERCMAHLVATPPWTKLLGRLGLVPAAWERSIAPRTLISRLNQVIAFALTTGEACAFPEGKDLYDELVHVLGDLDGIAIISLNYDILFEEAVWRHAGEQTIVWYPGVRFGQKELRVPIYKLHGSCNWIAMGGSDKNNPVPVTLGPDGTMDTQREHAVLGSRANVIGRMKRRGDQLEVVMAQYMPGKPVPWNWRAVEYARRYCLHAIHANPDANVTMVGVHVPASGDDAVLETCLIALGRLRGRRQFVNPSRDELAAAEPLGFHGRPLTLREYIAEQQSQHSRPTFNATT